MNSVLEARMELLRATDGGIGIIMANAIKSFVDLNSDRWFYDWVYDPICHVVSYRSKNHKHSIVFYVVQSSSLHVVAKNADKKKNCYLDRRGKFSLADPELPGKLVQFLVKTSVL